jgi:hypothetical protein
MQMLRLIPLFITLLFAAPSFATEPQPCSDVLAMTEGKSQSDVDAILTACREQRDAAVNATTSIADPDNAAKWSVAARGIAEAIGVAARELGVATNDFLDSPAGYVVAGLLFVNFGADFSEVITDLVRTLVGIPLLLVLLWYSYRSRPWYQWKREYQYVPVLWGAFSVRRLVKCDDGFHRSADDGDYWIYILTQVFNIVALAVVVL